MSDETGEYIFAVWPLNEIRGGLPAILERFAAEGPLSPPVVVGRHRKPEAALVPYRLLARLVEAYEETQAPTALADEFAGRATSDESAFVGLESLS